MNPWREKILPGYEVRKTKSQKTRFIAMLEEHYGDGLRVEECGGLVRSRNIVIGNPDEAKVVFTAHYDTCARLPFPNFITPKNPFIYIAYQLLLTLILILPPFVLAAAAAWLTDSVFVTEAVLLAVFIAEIYLMLAGVQNPHTANDNTSGVVTALTLADRLIGNKNAAFVLFDNEEVGLLGSSGFAKKHPELQKSGFVVNFDCVSDGDNILLLEKTKAATPETESIIAEIRENAPRVLGKYGKNPIITKKAIYPSDQAAFRNSLAVAALNKSKRGILYMSRIHTPDDTVFDESCIDALAGLFSGIGLFRDRPNDGMTD